MGEKTVWDKNRTRILQSQQVNEVPDATTKDYGFFLQGFYQHSDKLSFNFGIRQDIIESEVIRDNQTIESEHSPPSGNIGFLYEINSIMKIGGNIGTAFRIPSVKEKYYIGETPQGMNYGNPDLKPERSVNMDLNLKFKIEKLPGVGFYGNIGFFNNHVKDLVAIKWDKPSGDRTGYFENIGNARIYGIETNLHLKLIHGWFFSGAIAYVKGTDADTRDILMDIPPVQINLHVKKLFNKGRAWIGFHIRHSAAESQVVESDIPTDAFTLIDLSAGVKLFKYMLIRLSANNLLNSEYREYFNLVNIYGRGRGFQTSVEINF